MRIHMRGVHKYYDGPLGKYRVLENVELRIEKGEFIAIMGPSGSGKSTLLLLLGCIDRPTFGQIFLEESDVATRSETERERIRLHHIGFIFQNYNLLPTLNALENVTLPMELANLNYREQRSRGLSLLRLVGLENRADEDVTNLSGGQQQRVAIARALANLPGLVLADEPTGNLDSRASREVMEVIRTVNENQHITTVLVTHDPKVAAYADRVVYLDDGRIKTTAV